MKPLSEDGLVPPSLIYVPGEHRFPKEGELYLYISQGRAVWGPYLAEEDVEEDNWLPHRRAEMRQRYIILKRVEHAPLDLGWAAPPQEEEE